MDKNVIKKYAVWAREQLIEKVTARAVKYQIVDGQKSDGSLETINGEVLSETERKQRNALIQKIKVDGYGQVMEEVAYTWFNRFVAIRFMEVNGYLPSHVRVFSDENGVFKPQILAEALHLDLPGLDIDKVMQYKEEANEEALFKYLLKVQCNALNEILPQMFQKIEDYTELLLPDYLLREGSVLQQMIIQIPETDWNDAVQIIGWLYQYYWSDLRDDLNDKTMVEKEELPAKTQFFTPDWICRYMVENSLGRVWINCSRDEKIKANWEYYLDEAEQNDEVNELLHKDSFSESIRPQDLRILDPCMGSGHVLVYAFDVLIQIYGSVGYSEREAAKEIVQNNLFGLDVDDRAGQLAYFAVMMKARKYCRNIFSYSINPQIMAIKESRFITKELIDYVSEKYSDSKKSLEYIRDVFKEAKEFGSMIAVDPLDYTGLIEHLQDILQKPAEDLFETQYHKIIKEELIPLVKQAIVFSQKYDAVVTNPPYLGVKKYNPRLSNYINTYYKDYKYDLFSCIVYKSRGMLTDRGYAAFITQQTWLNVDSFEKFRKFIASSTRLLQLVHLGSSTMDGGLGTASFVFAKNKLKKYLTLFVNLTAEEIETKHNSLYKKELQTKRVVDNFMTLPKSVFSYDLSERVLELFDEEPAISKTVEPRSGLVTRNNARFLRLWFEVKNCDINYNCDKTDYSLRWYPHVKGGGYRKWYGNLEYVVNWKNNGKEIREATKDANGGSVVSEECYFEEGLSWSLSTFSTKFSMRYLPKGIIFNVEAPAVFNVPNYKYMLGLLNTKVGLLFLDIVSDNVHYKTKDVGSTPYILDNSNKEKVEEIVASNIEISIGDWNSFETSWNFEIHPFIKVDRSNAINGGAFAVANTAHYYEEGSEASCPIEASFMLWKGECSTRFHQLKENEEELNRIFIDIYGLQDELTPEVEDKDVTVRLADLQRDIRSFISYAVGCMFGRYSLDVPGLAYAGGDWNASKYKTFQVDSDAIIPICDDEYFEDDIVGRFVKFVEVVFGKDTVEDNLKFIADALGGNGTSREVIRNYFINDFYDDHVKVYQKRPIYWLFDSGKKNGFKCLIYMHRYQPDTIARIRTDYVHEQQARYRTAIEEIEKRIESTSGSDKIKLEKKLNTLRAQDDEIHSYEEKIHHLADQMISIDLDDGVKHNYDLFKDVLAKIK